VVRLRKGLASHFWEEIVRGGAEGLCSRCPKSARPAHDPPAVRAQLLALIGEQFDVGGEICGAIDVLQVHRRHHRHLEPQRGERGGHRAHPVHARRARGGGSSSVPHTFLLSVRVRAGTCWCGRWTCRRTSPWTTCGTGGAAAGRGPRGLAAPRGARAGGAHGHAGGARRGRALRGARGTTPDRRAPTRTTATTPPRTRTHSSSTTRATGTATRGASEPLATTSSTPPAPRSTTTAEGGTGGVRDARCMARAPLRPAAQARGAGAASGAPVWRGGVWVLLLHQRRAGVPTPRRAPDALRPLRLPLLLRGAEEAAGAPAASAAGPVKWSVGAASPWLTSLRVEARGCRATCSGTPGAAAQGPAVVAAVPAPAPSPLLLPRPEDHTPPPVEEARRGAAQQRPRRPLSPHPLPAPRALPGRAESKQSAPPTDRGRRRLADCAC